MSALAAPRIVKQLASATRRLFPVAANTVIWEGAMVALSGSGSSAVAVPASANSALKIVGVATGDNNLAYNGNNLGGAAGAVQVAAEIGVFLMNNSSTDPVALGDIGASVYAADDNTVSKTSNSGAQPVAGVLFNLDPSGGVWVKFA